MTIPKFRGKSVEVNKFVYGFFTKYKHGGSIIPYIQIEKESDFGDYIYNVEIDINTLCQYTGMNDENGKEIYENDIITGLVDLGQLGFIERTFRINKLSEYNLNWRCFNPKSSKVIGNIYENKELEGVFK